MPLFKISRGTLYKGRAHVPAVRSLPIIPSLLLLLSATTVVLSATQTVFSTPVEQHNADSAHPPSDWPHVPFKTRGRDIVNSKGEVVHLAGVNWPMSGETMIFEGLEWASAENIVNNIASVGFNFVRAGYAIEMVDQIYERNGADVPLEEAMVNALGQVNGTKVTESIIKHNPQWTKTTTRFEIFGDVVDLAAKKGIFVHPDVHVGKAQWCCSHTDGNAWFDDIYFPASNWKRGLAYIANFAKKHSNIVSMSLRNELRSSYNDTTLMYNWHTLVGNMTEGADTIYNVNPDLLITWSGMQYDEDLSALTSGKNLLNAPAYKADAIRDSLRRDAQYFDLDAHPWADKLVWELHLYGSSEVQDTGACDIIEAELYRNGFNALGIAPPKGCGTTKDCPKAVRLTPVILSEFGHEQASSLYDDLLQNCLKEFTKKHGISWAMWALAGSYRIRSGVQDFDDTWGLTTADWSKWRDPDTVEHYWKPWVHAMQPTKL
ncbi:glycoside hydrolase family 5 protein [Tilletiaria anomala UBC 951]|uniref:Glycoside hydrolase family 5 protein n=1 Tax=Tilletiaria anomala (strain ATCC 24038 / CBS 436.72 / UBC 951) TaxID=1037660 RepID=A0A066WGE3_TILAU|nr:glycoside hydrolase family 5 protein [Tilletiaria anomala UBC 951]KDN53057.1 glycoside hydrolase family 5 protein [Tilletiaria anomala UBC 951]